MQKTDNGVSNRWVSYVIEREEVVLDEEGKVATEPISILGLKLETPRRE